MKVLSAILIIIILAISNNLTAEFSSLKLNLEPGQYQVGYKVVQLYDHTRIFKREIDYFGFQYKGETARPIQISIWYPASTISEPKYVPFSRYIIPQATEVDFAPLTQEKIDTILSVYIKDKVSAGANEHRIQEMLKSLTNAVEEAKPAEGKFPLIVYASSFSSSPWENSILFEYLASHGFIIAALPSVGQFSRVMSGDAAGLEAQARDLEFTAGYMNSFPSANMSMVGALGFSWGGLSNVLFAARNLNVDAVASLEGAIGKTTLEKFTQHPGLDYKSLRAAFLDACAGTKDEVDTTFYDSLKYATMYLVQFHKLSHGDFAISALRSSLDSYDPDKIKNRDDLIRSSEAVCKYVLEFFKAYLTVNPDAESFMQNKLQKHSYPDDLVTSRFKKAIPAPPYDFEFFSIIQNLGVNKAIELFNNLRKNNPSAILFQERQMNELGYLYLRADMVNDAIALFKLNMDSYPGSANVYDSLGEAYIKAGNIPAAKMHYQKSLLLNPKNTNAKRILDQLDK